MSQNSKGLKLKQERECGRLVSSHWSSDDLIHLFPTFLKLSEREKSMLDAKGMRFPDPSGKVMSVAQQNSTLSFGHTGCLVPTNVVWLGERGRLLRGCEMLRLQGVFISRSLEQEFPNALLADLADFEWARFSLPWQQLTPTDEVYLRGSSHFSFLDEEDAERIEALRRPTQWVLRSDGRMIVMEARDVG